MATNSVVCVPIASEVYNELVIRVGNIEANVNEIIEQVVGDYLDRTEDEGYWSDAFCEILEKRRANSVSIEEYGDPSKGYYWQTKGPIVRSVFLPNGTKLRMKYHNEQHYAEIKNEKIVYNGKSFDSPSQLARCIADDTSRNAWRDFYIKRPKDNGWLWADSFKK